MRVLITGANGFIGSRLCTAATEAGIEVVTLTRENWSGLPDVRSKNRFFGELPLSYPSSAFVGVDVVVHCAGTASSDWQRARAINVLGTKQMAYAARAAGVRGFVYLSSQSANPETPSPYGRTKYEAEEILRAEAGLDIVVLRPGLVCGGGGLFGRVAALVRKLPVIPLVAANSPVQPIAVGDLIDAILRCVQRPEMFAGQTLNLGLSRAVRLEELMRLVGRHDGRRPLLLPVPLTVLWPLVNVAERLGLPLPISRTTLIGMSSVAPMQTANAMRELRIPERSVDEIVRLALEDFEHSSPSDQASNDQVRALLIGAGRIGLVHGATLARQRAVKLAGIVDPDRRARNLIRSIGIKAPMYSTLEQAFAADQFDMAIVSTPPSSHLSLTTACTRAGVAVLVEKPACPTESLLSQFEVLARTEGQRLLVGYLMPRMPHIASAIERLRAGHYGTVRSFAAVTLVSLVDDRPTERWETRKEVSGGGVLSNSSSHVLSLIYSLFGHPAALDVQVRSSASRDVEDAAIIRFDYGGWGGVHYSSWSIAGFSRQDNTLQVTTNKGLLTMTASCAVFESPMKPIEVDHQLDHDVGFNLAPDYSGAGITVEQRDLLGAATNEPSPGAITLARGLEIERLLFRAYDVARAVERFSGADDEVAAQSDRHGPSRQRRQSTPLILDLRQTLVPPTFAALPIWSGAIVRPRDLSFVLERFEAKTLRVTVPHFLAHARALANKDYAGVARALGKRGSAAAVAAVITSGVRWRAVGFWNAAFALLAAELQVIPANFPGAILIDPYLVDLAIAVGEYRRLDGMLAAVRRARPHATVGVHSNLGRNCADALMVRRISPEILSLLASPNRDEIREIRQSLHSVGADIRLEAEVGPAPLSVHISALADPERWGTADALIVSGLADPVVGEHAERRLVNNWTTAFPGCRVAGPLWLLGGLG